MDYNLETFLKNEGYYTNFQPFIRTKRSTTTAAEEEKAGETTIKRIKYKFTGDMHQIIADFLSKNETLAKEKFTKDTQAEESYLKEVPKRSYKHRGRKNSRDNTEDIVNIFKDIFKTPKSTAIIKQYEKRYQHIIEKETFTEEQTELIDIGVFFFALAYYAAKQEKNVARKDTDKSPAEVGKIKLDNTLNSPQYMTRTSPRIGLPTRLFENLLYNYTDNKTFEEDIEKLSPTDRSTISNYIKSNANTIKSFHPFNTNLQKGIHSVLWDGTTLSSPGQVRDDPFILFIFGIQDSSINNMFKYPYFFKDSEETKLNVEKKPTEIPAYTHSKCPEKITKDYLDANLKPVWFRDITKENKNYQKLSTKELHATAEAYNNLISSKIIKCIEIKYQCKKDGIFVSFKTNNFETPPEILSEGDFKKLYRQYPKRVLYRGMKYDVKTKKEYTQFKKMKQKGIAYNIRKHNGREYGAGVYWTADLNQAKEYGDVVAMGIAVDDLQMGTNAAHTVRDPALTNKMFLMRDNQSIAIREKAVYLNKHGDIKTESARKDLEKYDLIAPKNEAEINKWLKCE